MNGCNKHWNNWRRSITSTIGRYVTFNEEVNFQRGDTGGFYAITYYIWTGILKWCFRVIYELYMYFQ